MTEVAEKEIKELEGKALSITEYAGGLEVASEEDMTVAHSHLKAIKGLIKEVKETFDPVVEAAHATHKKSVAAKNKHLEPLTSAEGVIKGKIGGYMDICERQREEEERLAREKAIKEQEKKLKAAKKRIVKLIEEGGDLQEQIARLEKESEDPELTEAEEAAFTAQLEVLRAQVEGNAEKVEAKKAEVVEPTYIPPVAPVTPRPKVKGLSSSVKKVGTVTNPTVLIKAVAAGTIPVTVIKFDMAAINKLLNAGMTLPGVNAKDDRIIAVR